MTSSSNLFLGVDVGTGSVRAGLVDQRGRILEIASRPLKINNPRPDHYEQSVNDIWSGVVHCIRQVIQGVEDKSRIIGIGFDATCSLVVLDESGCGLCVNQDEDESWDVMMWMDHRAKVQTEHINNLEHPQVREVLQFVGGSISLEMQVPKLLWIKENLAKTWPRARHFFDLSDFLTFKATGHISRSLCATICKWTYLANLEEGSLRGWSRGFFDVVGLEDLTHDDFAKLGKDVLSPGKCCGNVSQEFALATGLSEHIRVGASLIDAHAGVLGMLACSPARNCGTFSEQLSIIAGTSTCHMALSKRASQVPGVWGPYLSAILPKFWLLEGGQTAVGKLIDHILETHPAHDVAMRMMQKLAFPTIQAYLEHVLSEMKDELGLDHVALIARSFHIWPDFHGNRSPLADPEMTGMISGLTLSKGVKNMAKCYLAAIQAVTYGTAHILEEMTKQGQDIRMVTICGGLSKSEIFVQTQADVLGLPVIQPNEKESVLLGAAMLGAAAVRSASNSNDEDYFTFIVEEMMGGGQTFLPNPSLKAFHDAKYQVFRAMGRDQLSYRHLMEQEFCQK
ncbi:FGGY carbohydrate kinase domain-containing protein-like [Tigriopus californicus]|uniref:FGGY carbohydrate kinase domain-containing protein-like n=1 Tax=Tigriopus californicus TaxID=6832 RepID=UPI0027D9EE8A|nr:FGGY carbohydrate kinase domain-containing protein-like [Tigriopus californicus]